MERETVELLKEIKALRSASDPIKEALLTLPVSIDGIKIRLESLESFAEEINKDVNGYKDNPSLSYRIKKLEEGVSLYAAAEKTTMKLKSEVQEIAEWKEEKEEAQKELKKMTTETLVKTVIPWVLFLIASSFAAYWGYLAGS